jgi:RimJ/RimL family protein N-acetyltransferase
VLRYPDPELADAAVALRPFTAGDVPALAAAADDEILRFAYGGRLAADDERAAAAFIAEQLPALLEAGSAVMLGLFARADASLLGAVSLSKLDFDTRTGELGCWVAPGVRGRRVGERGCRLICAWGFDVLGLHRIQAVTDVENVRAERGLRSMRFVCEGTMRGVERRGEAFVDCRCWSLLATDAAARELVRDEAAA